MDALRDYERKVIEALTGQVLPRAVLRAVTSSAPVTVEHTAAGYFLTVRHPGLPKARMVCNKPILIGKGQGVETGFVIFLEDHELTLECHAWGGESVPDSYRDQDVEIVAT